jgi:hypothetical protein
VSIGRRTSRRGLAAAALLVLLALVLAAETAAIHWLFTSRYPGLNDFYVLWQSTRAWLIEGLNPYSAEVTLVNQIVLTGRAALPHEHQLQYAYPLYAMLLWLPALFADYAWASAWWLVLLQVALLALLGLSLAWSGWRPGPGLLAGTVLFHLLWYHAARTLVLGAPAGMVAPIIAGALVCAQRGRDGWAGVLLALAAAKPQMAFLIIPAMWVWAVSRGRWRLVAWSAGTLAVLAGGSFLLLPSWLGDWLGQIPIYARTTINAPPAAVIAGVLIPAQAGLAQGLLSAALLALVLWAWRGAWGRTGERFEWAAMLTLATTCLIAPRTATTDYLMLTPVLFALFARLARGGPLPVAALQAALFVGLWALFLFTLVGDQEHASLYLPLPLLLWGYLLFARPAAVAGGRSQTRHVEVPA